MDQHGDPQAAGHHREVAEAEPCQKGRQKLGHRGVAEGEGQGGDENGVAVTEGADRLENGPPEQQLFQNGGKHRRRHQAQNHGQAPGGNGGAIGGKVLGEALL